VNKEPDTERYVMKHSFRYELPDGSVRITVGMDVDTAIVAAQPNVELFANTVEFRFGQLAVPPLKSRYDNADEDDFGWPRTGKTPGFVSAGHGIKVSYEVVVATHLSVPDVMADIKPFLDWIRELPADLGYDEPKAATTASTVVTHATVAAATEVQPNSGPAPSFMEGHSPARPSYTPRGGTGRSLVDSFGSY